MTEAEISFVKTIFKNEIDVGIRKQFVKAEDARAAARTMGSKRIKFYGKKFHEEDYIAAKEPFALGLFLHETTHVWQFQNGWRATNMDPELERKYDHSLNPHSSFEEYGTEQQASIMENYARRFLGVQLLPSMHSSQLDTLESDALLQKVVEDRFPGAKKLRLERQTANWDQVKSMSGMGNSAPILY